VAKIGTGWRHLDRQPSVAEELGLSQADEVRTEVLERITVAFRARPSSSATEG
jgi:hypothetical protein